MPSQKILLNDIDRQLLKIALEEDLSKSYIDLTSTFLFSDNQIDVAKAYIISKHPAQIIVCGVDLIHECLSMLNSNAKIIIHAVDGTVINPGEKIATIEAKPCEILMIERVILNFLQRLSAIATTTGLFVDKIKNTALKILDTRKTTPGLRHLEKYAVSCGGGVNHRFGLYDALMIKDTHIDALGGVSLALQKLPDNILEKHPVILEVRNFEELKTALERGQNKITRVLLDNMSLEELKTCVNFCKGRIATEASGNIDLNNIQAIAATGVDFASIGKITHSAGVVDLSMQCELKK